MDNNVGLDSGVIISSLARRSLRESYSMSLISSNHFGDFIVSVYISFPLTQIFVFLLVPM